MSVASLFGGLALANARLGAVHGFAGPIGGTFHAPHGAVCARLLPNVMAANIEALQARAPEHEALQRYADVARFLTGDQDAPIERGPAWVRELTDTLKIAPLSDYGLTDAVFPDLVQRVSSTSSMQGNPIPLTAEELTEILRRSL